MNAVCCPYNFTELKLIFLNPSKSTTYAYQDIIYVYARRGTYIYS